MTIIVIVAALKCKLYDINTTLYIIVYTMHIVYSCSYPITFIMKTNEFIAKPIEKLNPLVYRSI